MKRESHTICLPDDLTTVGDDDRRSEGALLPDDACVAPAIDILRDERCASYVAREHRHERVTNRKTQKPDALTHPVAASQFASL